MKYHFLGSTQTKDIKDLFLPSFRVGRKYMASINIHSIISQFDNPAPPSKDSEHEVQFLLIFNKFRNTGSFSTISKIILSTYRFLVIKSFKKQIETSASMCHWTSLPLHITWTGYLNAIPSNIFMGRMSKILFKFAKYLHNFGSTSLPAP